MPYPTSNSLGSVLRGVGGVINAVMNPGSALLKAGAGIMAGRGGGASVTPTTTTRGAGAGAATGKDKRHQQPLAVYTLPDGSDQFVCMPGWHAITNNDSLYYGMCVKNRHANPLNPRALRRAVRRTHAFTAIAKRALAGQGLHISRNKR